MSDCGFKAVKLQLQDTHLVCPAIRRPDEVTRRCGQLVLHELIPQSYLLGFGHLCRHLTIAIGQGIAVKGALGHDNAKVLKSLCFTREHGFQLCIGLVLANVVEGRHVPSQTSQGRGHLIGCLFTKTECFSHCAEGASKPLSHGLGQAEGGYGVLGKVVHLFGHTWERDIHHILDFRQVGPQFNTLCAEVYDFLYCKRRRESSSRLFSQPLYSGHLLFKLILVDHKVKANLAYAVSCHTYHLPFNSKAGSGSLLLWCGSRLCHFYIQPVYGFTSGTFNFPLNVFRQEKGLSTSYTSYFLNLNHLRT